MNGPSIIARTLTATSLKDKAGNNWQYLSRSDRHSKVACWAIMFDLMQACPLLRRQIAAGTVGFGINHQMVDFQTGRKKDLDLVISTTRAESGTNAQPGKPGATFTSLRSAYSIVLTQTEEDLLLSLPTLRVVDIGDVLVALEAKATMTEHVKALPRLHDELDSSHATVHGHSDTAIAVGLVMINASTIFHSPDRNKNDLSKVAPIVNIHKQPKAVDRTLAKVRQIRRRTRAGEFGFDAIGVVVVDFKNDGSSCQLINSSPAPTGSDIDAYENMIGRVATIYSSKFREL